MKFYLRKTWKIFWLILLEEKCDKLCEEMATPHFCTGSCKLSSLALPKKSFETLLFIDFSKHFQGGARPGSLYEPVHNWGNKFDHYVLASNFLTFKVRVSPWVAVLASIASIVREWLRWALKKNLILKISLISAYISCGFHCNFKVQNECLYLHFLWHF